MLSRCSKVLFPTCRHYWKNSPVRPDCDYECRKRILCDAKSGRSHDRKYFCEDVEAKIDENNKGWKEWIFSSISSSYVTYKKLF